MGVRSSVDVLYRPHLDPDTAGLDPDSWRNAGKRLLKGARLAWKPLSESFRAEKADRSDKSDYFAPFFLCGGLALENYLKARILEDHIAAGTAPTNLYEVMSIVYRTHDLVSLATRANLTLTRVQTELLERLTEFVEWSSRYPVPLPKKKDQVKYARRGTKSVDLARIEAIVQLTLKSSP